MLSDIRSRIMVANEERWEETSRTFRARRRLRTRRRSTRRRKISVACLVTQWQERMSTQRLSRKLRRRFLSQTQGNPPRL
jgi:hypothetical protein